MERQMTKNKFKFCLYLLLFVCFGWALNSCYFDNEEELYPAGNCSNENVSYSLNVVPILENACYECHDLSNAPILGDGINLEGYAKLKAYISGEQNVFIGSLKWNGQGSPMPKDGTKIDFCSIDKIEVWINEGMLNN